ncbi:hypothetical protein acsn021_10630 [Anaerocolumna cellulosilytica]|uniref:Uncharacterized protein n=1 Tax=Anaerocolumna cellulosilytica TaxID=433286 RepID=A0A6S6QSA4_9FIRM|nr:DUF6709 family protein [Anaerocolumna cellulosilytica]MBB5194550.1 hypothetical protein [Anaerocolumna cellulosilytica]BCJ93494.1 hypothetical protein acsn021_10630 [Anaerocolumna cellulosilytica]
MLNELKKLSNKRAIVRIGLVAAALIMVLIFFTGDFVKSIQGPKDLYSINAKDIPGAYVTGEITAMIDPFAEYYTYDSDGTKNSTEQYYIIPVGEEEYAAIEIKPEDFDIADRIYYDTYDYLYGNIDELTVSMKITGTFQEMDPEMVQYFEETIAASDYFYDFSEEEIDKLIYPYVLKKDMIGSNDTIPLYLIMALTVVLFLYIIIVLIKIITGAYLNSIRKYISNNESSTSQERIEADFENAVKVESTRIGETWTYYFDGLKPMIINNSDIIWAYQEIVTHRRNGIKVGTTKSVILYNRNKNKITLAMKKTDSIELILETYARQHSHIVMGYSENLKATLKKDFEGFLRLAYQQNASQQTEDSSTWNDSDFNA